jgi:hypothetical protein
VQRFACNCWHVKKQCIKKILWWWHKLICRLLLIDNLLFIYLALYMVNCNALICSNCFYDNNLVQQKTVKFAHSEKSWLYRITTFSLGIKVNQVFTHKKSFFLNKFFFYVPFSAKMMSMLKGQSHEKVGKMSVWGISLGTN